jgi:hypothetical protein
MKTKEKSHIEKLRDIRDKINAEIQDLTHKQLMQYLDKQQTLHPKAMWQKHGKAV